MHTLYTLASMKPEITAAVGFLSRFLRTKGLVNERQLQTFSQSLQDLLSEQYKHHWFPDRPCKGSGYRCIRINHKMDPVVGQAAQRIGLSIQQLYQQLPSELTLWVDPFKCPTASGGWLHLRTVRITASNQQPDPSVQQPANGGESHQLQGRTALGQNHPF